MYRWLPGLRTAQMYRGSPLARRQRQQYKSYSRLTRPRPEYSFSEFHAYREAARQERPEPTRALLRRFFNIHDDDEALYVEGDYHDWANHKRASVDVAALLKENWNLPSTRSVMESALIAGHHHGQWDLGFTRAGKDAGEMRLRLKIDPVFSVPYFSHVGMRDDPDPGPDHDQDQDHDPSEAVGPILFTSATLQIPRADDYEAKGHLEVSDGASSATSTSNGSTLATQPERRLAAFSGSWTKVSPTPRYLSTTVIRELDEPKDIPTPLPGFDTKLVHLGRVRGAPRETPYAVVGALSDAGTVRGLFAIPVKNEEEVGEEDNNDNDYDADTYVTPMDDEGDGDEYGYIEEGYGTAATSWEDMPRGIYYLGRDLDDCRDREWVLCRETDHVTVVCPVKQ